MAQETETVGAVPAAAVHPPPPPATLESPSPKRRNRKKGRRDEDDDSEQEVAVSPCVSPLGDVATADLVSLPSPVANASSSGVDVFAEPPVATHVEKAMERLVLTAPETATEAPAGKEDGLLKLPVHPSSGRLPLTPPPTPEPFMVHSPEKEQPRVAPMSPDIQLLPTVIETPADVATAQSVEMYVEEVVTAATVTATESILLESMGTPSETASITATETIGLQRVETETTLTMEALTPVVETTTDPEPMQNATVEQETSALNNTLADLSLSKGPTESNALEASQAVIEEVASKPDVEFSNETMAEDVVPVVMETSVEAAATIPSPVLNRDAMQIDPVAGDHVTMSLPPMANAEANSISARALSPAKTPSVAKLENTEAVARSSETPSTQPLAINEVRDAPPALSNEAMKVLAESPQPLRRNKRKGDSPGQKPHSAPVVVSKAHAKTHQDKFAALPTAAEQDTKSKHVVSNDKLNPFHPQQRYAKRKGDGADANPPPAPVTEPAKQVRSKRLVARSNSGSTLNKANIDHESKLTATVTARPMHDSKKDSMMNPTASSLARATAAEARKALLKNGLAKKSPSRKPMKPKAAAKQQQAAANLPSGESLSVNLIPVGVPDADNSERNVKRRLNATDVEAASKRLYEDAKEAKLRKDARRAELQETYTFAPQVNNNFKRRANAGEVDEPSQDHFMRLHAQAKELMEKKRELQQQHERDGCTFAPSISARAKRMARMNSAPRYENLYKHAQELKQKREEKILEKTKTTEEQCPFKPKITVSKSPVKTKPLYDSEREKQKRLALEQKKIEAEMTECTFKPKVSTKRIKSKAEDPANAPPNDAVVDANPYKRLYQASIDRTERLQKLRQERDEEEKAHTTFHPKITARSRALKAKTLTKEPFYKRLYNKDYMKKLDAEREQRRLEEEQQFTFKVRNLS
ncbi:unnamed protein product [Phytophthora fragariaefolia]|uniref:Unnamed protein product n=1 Tax=Phytophthora fragariaefolia TaxID=1490495 RepID=A0A9W6UER3_9STRA|nr:unnamed protein product [Phytophthora fragariaefolia]